VTFGPARRDVCLESAALGCVVLGEVLRTREASIVVAPQCPIRLGEACSLCVPGASGPADCGLVYLVMSDPELREDLNRMRRGVGVRSSQSQRPPYLRKRRPVTCEGTIRTSNGREPGAHG